MSSIDERVVQMKFDNSQFQKGVSDTNKSLADLKQGLNLDGAAKSLQGLDAAGKNFSLAGMAAGVEAIGAKFSALSILGITALVNIGNQAINTGINLVKSLTIGPIADGFSDYNAKLSSVQTIMNATGASIEVVSGHFSELDTYADKTIYNLTDMTGAFAKFTNAGVGMDKSVPAIKGIANMVALAGQDAGAASIAMYNLSQSIAGGFLTTTDYKSLNLANVATKEWKGQMVEAAVAAGKLEKVGDKYHVVGMKAGTASDEAQLFNENLAEGWASADVLMGVLGDYGDTQTDIGKKAQAAAQDVKSFGMMMETLKAGVGTGWTDTFEIVVGNLHEAKALFTPLTASVGEFLTGFDKARNDLLKGWKDLGGRDDVIETFKDGFSSLVSIINPIKDAFREIFPPITAQNLKDITGAIREFVAHLKPSEDTINKVKSVAKGLFAAIDIGRMIVVGIIGVLARLFGSVSEGSGGFLTIAANIGDFILRVRDAIKNGEGLQQFFQKLGDILQVPIDGLKNVGKWLGDIFNGFGKVDTSVATAALDNVKDRVETLKDAGDGLSKVWGFFGDVLRNIMNFFAPLGAKIAEVAGKIGTGIADAVKGTDFNTVLDAINTGLFAGLILLIRKFFKGGFGEKEGGGLLDTIKGAFGGLTDTLGAMQTTLKAGTLILIAGAIALLTGSILILSTIDSGKLMSALAAIGAMMGQLMLAMFILDKISTLGGAVKITVLAVAMGLFAIAIGFLALSMKLLATMSWEELAKGLVGVIALLMGIAGALKLMSGVKGNLIGAGIGMIAIAIAIKILASAVKDFSELSWEEMGKGLTGVGAVLAALALFTRLAKVNKGAMAQGAGLVLLAFALKIIASVVKDFGDMGVEQLIKGLGSITLVLAALAAFTNIVQPAKMISTATAMAILGGALKILATAVKDFANMSWDELIRGGVGLAGTLLVIALAMNLMPANMLLTAIGLVVVAAALKIIASAFKDMGGMSWDEIGRGMVVLAGSLAILVGAMYLMSGAILGALAMIVVAGALAIMTPCLVALGKMSWDEIGRGLTMLAAAFVVIGLAGLVLTPVIPSLIALGIAIALLGIGAALVGVGLLAFSAGLAALAVSGAAGAAALIAIVSGLLGLIPMAFTQIGLGIVAFAVVLGESAPALVGALVALLTSLITAIATVTPLIVKTMVDLVLLLLAAIVDNTPKFIDGMIFILNELLRAITTMAPALINTMTFLIHLLVETILSMVNYFVDAGMRLIIGILTGIGNRIGEVVDAGARIIVEFLNGIGRNIPKIVQAGVDLIIDFVNGLANGIRNNTARMEAAGGNLASAIIDGMTSGIRNGINTVVNAAKDMAANALQGAKDLLGIKSPSREFKKLGAFSSEGFADGIIALTPLVGKASERMGKTALSSMKSSLAAIGDGLSTNIDINPTIRPVLDLSDIKKNSGLIGGMLTPPHLAVEGSYAKASSLIARERTNQEVASSASETITQTGDTFVQNNYSPKALTPAEIYRNTKNQLSVARVQKKGALT